MKLIKNTRVPNATVDGVYRLKAKYYRLGVLYFYAEMCWKYGMGKR